MAAQVLLDKWAARGCDPKVLATVRKEVFNIDAGSAATGKQSPSEASGCEPIAVGR